MKNSQKIEEFFTIYGNYNSIFMPNKKYDRECFENVVYTLYNYSENAYELSGIDMQALKNAVKQREQKLIKQDNLISFSKSAYLYYRLKEENISIIDKKNNPCNAIELNKQEFEGIGIIAVYNDWVMIKKLSSNAMPYEVSAMLSYAIERFIEKYYLIKYGPLKKDYNAVKNLEQALEQLKQCKTEKDRIEKAFSFKGFRPFPFLDGLIKAYPDLKVKKPKGRISKK